MLIDFTEEELLVIGKLLAQVAGNKDVYSATVKVQKSLGYELDTEDFDTVKFYDEDTHVEIQDYIYIKIEETVLMDAQSFCYWLQGFVELQGKCPDEGQWEMIKEHLQLVFKKETKTKEQVQDWFDKVKQPEQSPVDVIGKPIDPDYWPHPHRPAWPFQPIITCDSQTTAKLC